MNKRVKIISNPYDRNIVYQESNSNSTSWKNVAEVNEESPLLGDKYNKCFFPFGVRNIVEEILHEYDLGKEKIEIIFEGTQDELNDLRSLCEEYYSDRIIVTESDVMLANARDILPEIIEIFKQVEPLVNAHMANDEETQREISKFTEASNDVVPVCVIGNYSSGKSSFINALVGIELLPSGEQPITAKVYKISNSQTKDTAAVKFKYAGTDCAITINNKQFEITGKMDNKLESDLKILCDEKSVKFDALLHSAMEIINDFKSSNDDNVGDLIEISVPFKNGYWNEVENQFVIFDTPGSNSATNAEHAKVLEEAMQNMSNGLPVFVASYNTLDSNDNEMLYDKISHLDSLDERFTLIVVNKADVSSLPKGGFSEEEIRDIVSGQAIPKKLYSWGMLFVSSIMGLGAKNSGEFIDEFAAEIFEDNKNKYIDPESRFHKELYKYNIMPEQLKKRSMIAAEKCEMPLYANSGLFSVEREIFTFAGKYSSYNKCLQSHMNLGNVLKRTSEEIDKKNTEHKNHCKELEKRLDDKQAALINRFEDNASYINNAAKKSYHELMEMVSNNVYTTKSIDSLKMREEQLNEGFNASEGLSELNNNFSIQMKEIGDDLKNNGKDVVDKKNLEALKKIAVSLVDDVKEAGKAKLDAEQVKKTAIRKTGEQLLIEVSGEFDDRTFESCNFMVEKSKAYWTEQLPAAKQHLLDTITNSSDIDDSKKSELAKIVMEYDDITFDMKGSEIFTKDKFMNKFAMLFENGRLNIKKIKAAFDEQNINEVDIIREEIRNNHQKSFTKWLTNLKERLIEDAVSLNPELRNLQNKIDNEMAEINELIAMEENLHSYQTRIADMMDWKS